MLGLTTKEIRMTGLTSPNNLPLAGQTTNSRIETLAPGQHTGSTRSDFGDVFHAWTGSTAKQGRVPLEENEPTPTDDEALAVEQADEIEEATAQIGTNRFDQQPKDSPIRESGVQEITTQDEIGTAGDKPVLSDGPDEAQQIGSALRETRSGENGLTINSARLSAAVQRTDDRQKLSDFRLSSFTSPTIETNRPTQSTRQQQYLNRVGTPSFKVGEVETAGSTRLIWEPPAKPIQVEKQLRISPYSALSRDGLLSQPRVLHSATSDSETVSAANDHTAKSVDKERIASAIEISANMKGGEEATQRPTQEKVRVTGALESTVPETDLPRADRAMIKQRVAVSAAKAQEFASTPLQPFTNLSTARFPISADLLMEHGGERLLDMSFATPAASGTQSLVHTTAITAEAVRNIGGQLAAAVANRPDAGSVEIALDPEELGRVQMTLKTRGDILTLTIFADRPETLDLMRRHIDELSADFRDMGFADVSFSFGGSQSETGDDTEQRSNGGEPKMHTPESLPSIEPENRLRIATSGLDIRL